MRVKPSAAHKNYSTAAKVTTVIVSAAALVHMFFTFTYNMPSDTIKNSLLPGTVATNYMQPFFVQDYKIFAPDPAGSDHQLWVRAWVKDPQGRPETTEWINVTAVEISDRSRKILRKQLSIVGAERLMGAYQSLNEEQRDFVARNYHRTGIDALREDLIAATSGDQSTERVDAFVRSTRYVDAYATQVAYALWADDGEIAAVQTRVVYDPVIRWADRNDPNAERPAASITDTGWRPLLEYPGQNREKFAATFLEWMDE